MASDRRPTYDAATRRKIKTMYDKGKSYRQIADALGLSVSRVHTLAADAGVRSRTVGSGKKVK